MTRLTLVEDRRPLLDWRILTCVVCGYGFFRDLRPSDAYLTNFLTSEWKNLTLTEVNNEIYPWWTYSYAVWLIPVLTLTDYFRYKSTLVMDGAAYIGSWILIIWAQGVPAMICMQVIYGLASAGEIGYFSYLYAKVEKQHYSKVAGLTKFSSLLGRFSAYLFGQFCVSYGLLDLFQLNAFSLCSVTLAFSIAVFLPPVRCGNADQSDKSTESSNDVVQDKVGTTEITDIADECTGSVNASTFTGQCAKDDSKPLGEFDDKFVENDLGECIDMTVTENCINTTCKLSEADQYDDNSLKPHNGTSAVTGLGIIGSIDVTETENYANVSTASSTTYHIDHKTSGNCKRKLSNTDMNQPKFGRNGSAIENVESTEIENIHNATDIGGKNTLNNELKYFVKQNSYLNNVKRFIIEVNSFIHQLYHHLKEAFSSRIVRLWSVWWVLASCGNFQMGSYIQNLWKVISHEANEDNTSYNGAVEAAGTLAGCLSVVVVGFLPVDWSVHGRCETLMATVCGIKTVLLWIVARTDEIWVAYVLFDVLRMVYHVTITIEIAEIAKALTSPRYSLVFGCNMFLALIVETVFTAVVVDKAGFGVDIRTQFMAYAVYSLVLTTAFGIIAAITIMCQPKSRGLNAPATSSDVTPDSTSVLS